MTWSLLSALLLLAGAASALPAGAQVNRCTAPDGTSVYTDRDCRALGAIERVPRGRYGDADFDSYHGGVVAAGPVPRDCARSIRLLVQEMAAAIDTGNVNRLAALYHWTGISTRAGQGLMDRLEDVTRYPLVDIVPLRAGGSCGPPPPAAVATLTAASHQPPTPDALPTATVHQPPPPVQHGPPVALRVHQTIGRGATPSHTTFSLRRHLDCWWITW